MPPRSSGCVGRRSFRCSAASGRVAGRNAAYRCCWPVCCCSFSEESHSETGVFRSITLPGPVCITCTSILTTSRSLFGINSVRSGNVSRDGRYFPDSPAGSAEAFFFDFCCCNNKTVHITRSLLPFFQGCACCGSDRRTCRSFAGTRCRSRFPEGPGSRRTGRSCA